MEKIDFISQKYYQKKIKYKVSKNLSNSLSQVFKNFIKEEEKIVLFSPSAASFDQFKNFEHRGKHFNKIIQKYLKK